MNDLTRIREALEGRPDEARVQRMWQAIDERRRAGRPAPRRRAWVAAAAVVVVGLAATGTWLLPRGDAGPLTLDDGHAVPPVLGGADPVHAVLSDDSAITTEPEARVEVLLNSAEAMTFALRRGRARFDVTPGGPRTWRVECGLLTVEVVGTSFVVERDASGVQVRVHRGAVLVRGETIRDRIERLGPGETLTVAAAPEPATPEAPQSASATEAPATVRAGDETPTAPASPDRRPAVAWRQAAEAGAYDEAFDALGGDGLAREAQRATSVTELMTLADVARLSGHPADAVSPLLRVVREHEADPRSALAAYTLARLELEQLGRPGPAAEHFAQSLELGLPNALREPALAKQVDALGRAGRPGVAAAATAYLNAYPEGRYRADVQRWRSAE